MAIDQSISLRVDEVLSPPDQSLGLRPGQVLLGSFSVGLPCAAPDARQVGAADVVFAAYQLEDTTQIPACLDAGVCRGESWLVPWQEILALGGAYSVAATDAGLLAVRETCLERFPVPPNPPCNDTITNDGCALANPGRRAPWAFIALVTALLALPLRRWARKFGAPG